MQRISGIGNWKLRYEIRNSEVIITRAVTCDLDAILPERILDLPVRELGDYALTARDREFSGEELEITTGRVNPDAEWSDRNLRSLKLPSGLRRIGSYAFMSDLKLERLEFYDEKLEWGVSPFMNCMALRKLVIYRTCEDCGNMAYLVTGSESELDVEVRDQENILARVLFPEYADIWEENTPARQLNHTMHGGGYPYHHAFRDRTLDWWAYDGLFESTCERGGLTEILTRLAWFRVRWPMRLEGGHRDSYLDYLNLHRTWLLQWVLENETARDLEKLLEYIEYTAEELQEGCDYAREKRLTQNLAVLLAKLGKEQPVGRKKTFQL